VTPPETVSARSPLIAYTIIHQPGGRSGWPAYEETVQNLHGALAEESRALDAEHREMVSDVSAQSALQLRTALSEFLSLPIRSDTAEVQRIFEEAFAGYLQAATAELPRGVVSSTEGELVPPPSGIAPRPRILATGKFLRSMGIVATLTSPPVYESVYLVRGGENLDVIEEIIRDRLGVYRTPHGNHLKARPRSAAGLYNMILVRGGAGMSGYGEAVVWFNKPRMTYEVFRGALQEIADRLHSLGVVEGVSFWQRKLGLGPGREFILRALLPDAGAFRRFLTTVRSLQGNAVVLDALRRDGVCFLKRWL
jgi:hypothetical protein